MIEQYTFEVIYVYNGKLTVEYIVAHNKTNAWANILQTYPTATLADMTHVKPRAYKDVDS